MKAVIACLLIVSATLAFQETVQPAIPSSSGLTMAEINHINELRNTKWGNIFITMAEMQLQSGPLDKLTRALNDMVIELEKAKSEENDRYAAKQATHEANVLQLNNQINAANSEVANNKLKIRNVLSKRKKQAEAEIARDSATVATKEDNIKAAKAERAKNKKQFEERVAELNKAIAATDDCIKLTGGLQNGQPSLVEIKKATMSIRRLELRLRQTHETETPLIEALIALASAQNFADQESVKKVQGLLNDFRTSLSRSLATEQTNEAKNIAEYKALKKQLRSEIAELKKNIRNNTKLIEITVKEIEAAKAIIAIKREEATSLKGKLDVENDAWRKETETHKELIDEILKEIDVVKQCITLFKDSNFSAFAKKKINQ